MMDHPCILTEAGLWQGALSYVDLSSLLSQG